MHTEGMKESDNESILILRTVVSLTGGPGGPGRPKKPLSPVLPRSPMIPAPPFAPSGPGGPRGPGEPCGPLGPYSNTTLNSQHLSLISFVPCIYSHYCSSLSHAPQHMMYNYAQLVSL